MLFLSGINSSSADFWNNNLWMNLAVSGRQSSNTDELKSLKRRLEFSAVSQTGTEICFYTFVPVFQIFWSDLQDLPQIDELLPSLVASCWQSASWYRCQRTLQRVGAVARNSFDGTCCCLAGWGWVAKHHGQGLLPALPQLGGSYTAQNDLHWMTQKIRILEHITVFWLQVIQNQDNPV